MHTHTHLHAHTHQTHPCCVGSWMILVMALQGKCPAVRKRRRAAAAAVISFTGGIRDRVRVTLDCGRRFALTVRDVRLLLLVALVSLAHRPAAVAAVAVRAEEVAPVLRPPHALQLLRVTGRGKKKKRNCQVITTVSGCRQLR